MTDKILSDGRTVQNTLEHLIAKHMPSAAVASGWVSPVDVSATVAAAVESHPPAVVEEWSAANGASEFTTFGLSMIKAYCAAHGLPVSDAFAKPFRLELLKCQMRAESNNLKVR